MEVTEQLVGESVLSLQHVASTEDGTQVIRFTSKGLYWLSHLTQESFCFL